MTVRGTFVQKGSYKGLINEQTDAGLDSTIGAAFPKGSILSLSMKVELIGMMPLCEAEGSYSVCGEVLESDGSCPSAKHHKVLESVEAD